MSTKELHPELGSGALREALERIEALSRWKFRGLAFVRLSEVLAALSLSSPIEPSMASERTIAIRNAYERGKKDGLAAQASSEIREALAELTELKRRMDSESGPKLWSYGTIYAYVVNRIEEMLDAGKRVEG